MDFLSSPLVIGILLGVVGIIAYLFLGNSNPQVDIPKVQEKPKKTKPVGPFTEEQVASHNKPDDYWIIINGKVYDVSEFYVEHPGGEVIISNPGKDNSVDFKKAKHPDYVDDMMDEYYLGELKK